jgi:hyperosmotically inducible periplasmic protein
MLRSVLGLVLVLGLPFLALSQNKQQQSLVKEVGHELRMLPYYTVFDDLAYSVNGNSVTLLGYVTNPTLKSSAERVVKNLEGVEQVNNQIEVLPLSPDDNQIRRAAYRAIYGQPGLDRYALSAMPSIHIIVKNGHITLVGVVDSEADKDRAGIAANSVPNAFSVTNDLKVVPGS